MKITLAHYKEGEQVQVGEQYDPKALDLEFIDLKYLAPVIMKGLVEKGPDTLFFRGTLYTETEHVCGRCLKCVKDRVNQPFDFIYETKNKEEIDTTDDLREALILDHPITFLCREDCRGLCPVCGGNRNESNCRCGDPAAVPSASSFKHLKEVWDKKMKEKKHG